MKLGDRFRQTYFIADIAANHDGSLERAKELIFLAAEAGADAAKFQNFKAETIVSKKGFEELTGNNSHQRKWTKSVVEVYREAEVPVSWTEDLIRTCTKAGIDYFTAPYDLNYVDYFAERMPFFKVGSGDITWKESLIRIASKGLPVMLATGASTIEEVVEAVTLLEEQNVEIVLMQCNTNYTGSEGNFDFLNLKVIESYKSQFPNLHLGLSDHSQGYIAVLGAVALGARFIEKHFTDDSTRKGPDHEFSLTPKVWKEMVESTRILERALGDGVKRVEQNETDARIVQRRGLRYTRDMNSDELITSKDLIALRPCPEDGLTPFELDKVLGMKLKRKVSKDEQVRFTDFEK
jgi:sialic acid synthase SpsE